MREAPGNLTPCGITLCLDECGQIVEHHNMSRVLTIVAWECGPSTNQHLPPVWAEQTDFGSPVRISGMQMFLNGIGKGDKVSKRLSE